MVDLVRQDSAGGHRVGADRREAIADFVGRHGSASVGVLAREFRVSPVTVHRDLALLSTEGRVRRVHGGAQTTADPEAAPKRNWDLRTQTRTAEKAQIAQAAMGELRSGDTVFLDASTTAYAVAQQLIARPLSALTVVTNSPQILAEINFPIHLVACPGEVDQDVNCISGRWAEDFLSSINISVAFLGGAAINLEHGLQSTQRTTADVNRAAAAAAARVVVVVDSRKFDKSALVNTISTDQIDRVLTDSGLTCSIRDRYRAAHVDVIAN